MTIYNHDKDGNLISAVRYAKRKTSGRALMRNGVTAVTQIEAAIPVDIGLPGELEANITVLNSRGDVTTGWIALQPADLVAWAKDIAIACEQDWRLFVYEDGTEGKTWTIAARSTREAYALLERRLAEDGYDKHMLANVEYLCSNKVAAVFDKPDIVLEHTF